MLSMRMRKRRHRPQDRTHPLQLMMNRLRIRAVEIPTLDRPRPNLKVITAKLLNQVKVGKVSQTYRTMGLTKG
jgi:hypothetical protein